jgi:glutathione S-transferase
MEYVDVATARDMVGLRLVLTRGVPGPWSESAKALFRLRDVAFVPVEQKATAANEALVEWTGHRNAPIAMYESEPPRAHWLEILQLAERLGSGPSLLPESPDECETVIGLSHLICGEGGLVWNGRHLMLRAGHQAQGDKVLSSPMYRDYGYSEETVAAAPMRIEAIVDRLSRQAAAQRERGRDYLVGESLSAVDVYWAFFSQLFDALPDAQNPMPEWLRAVWQGAAAAIGPIDPNLLDQRTRVFERHIELPLDF